MSQQAQTQEISQTHTHGEGYGHTHVGGELPHTDHEGLTVKPETEIPTDQSEAPVQTLTEGVPDSGAGFPFPTNLADIQAQFTSWGEQIFAGLQDPAFLAQIGAIIISVFLAPIVAGIVKRPLSFFRVEPKEGRFLSARHYLYQCRGFIKTVALIVLLYVSTLILKAIPMFGHIDIVKVVMGLVVILLLLRVIRQFVTQPLVRKVVTWVSVPIALLMVFGYFGKAVTKLEGTHLMSMGDTPITALTFIKLAIFGAIFFWLGGISNRKGQTAIRNQESLDKGTREVVAKIFQIILFALVFFIVMSVAGIPLSGLVFLISFAGLGIGLGLQPVAANFVSGLIILFDRTVQVGDFVLLPDGQEGFVEAINMRSTTVETTDGKDIMVPNTTFIENTYENWTHKDPRQRYEVYFQVEYGTDIDKLEDILMPVIQGYDKVLMEPELPDLELREFGDWGIKFAIEFWASGIDDGPNKFTSDLNFIVWRALKDNGIRIPLPQTEVRMLK